MLNKEIPICTDCGNELRQEFLVDENDRGYTSGYCSKCAKHFRLCGKTQYCNHCIRKAGHDGDHIDGNRRTWNDSFYDQFKR